MVGTTLLRRAMWAEKRARLLVFCLLAALVATSTGMVLGAKPTNAATTFTVNSTGDAGDTSPDGTCDSNFTVTVTCTLREAIQEANAAPTTDAISFRIPDDPNISGFEVKTISPASALPAITDAVTINGYMQAGAAVNTAITNANSAVLKVELNGAGAGAFSQGLFIVGDDAAGTTIRGLVINRFGGDGVFADAGGATIEGNFIGTNPSGTIDRGNGSDGVRVTSSGNVIGGAANEAQNVISGNAGNGVSVLGSTSTNNVVSNNHIGTDADAGADLGNSKDGVLVVRAPGVLVGGEDADGSSGAGHDNGDVEGEGNIISGNDGHGVFVDDLPAEGTKIFGNLIGLNRNGNGFSNIGNALDGVKVQNAPRVEIGGTQAGQGNTISDNGESGVEITGANATNNRVLGNRIGTDFNGASAFGNGGDGVLVGGASDTTIGGIGAGARNVISGNARDGVEMFAGTTETLVQGNFIGTDANGTRDLGNTDVGVFVRSPGNVVGGAESGTRNVISGNGLHGVLIAGSAATSNEVQGNFVGTDRNAVSDLGNTSDGVVIANAPGNFVGGSTVGARNVISGNDQDGVRIVGPDATENQVSGNFIGLDRDGSTNLGNRNHGVVAEDASGNLIGGTLSGARNVISGNASDGIVISGADATGNRIQGNFIGTDGTGVKDLGNRLGVNISGASGNFVGGTEPGAVNVISGNRSSGVGISGTRAAGNSVQGNLIGTNATGTAALGNGDTGLFINSASDNTIGGTQSGARNVISGNGGRGVGIDEPGATGNKVQGNFIGTDKDGTLDLGNVSEGVGVDLASGNLIGGTVSGARNVISGNGGGGVRIFGSGVTDGANNRVEGNFIGTNASGTQDLGNSLDGVKISGAPNNTIGGTVAGAGNVISGNDDDGVVSCCAGATGNRVLRNSIFSNGGLGIDLVGGTENATGATANDPKDPDTGPNALQNKPALGSATTSGDSLTVAGNLNSTPGKTLAIQFFSNPSGNEGKRFVGQRSVTTNANGNAPFTFTFDVSVAVGETITATATRAGNTSEFSGPRVAQTP